MVSRFPRAEEFVSLREAMDHLLSESFVGSPFRSIWSSGVANGNVRIALPLDVYADEDEVVVIAAIPGLRPEDIDITVNQNVVTLSGTLHNAAASDEAKQATWYLHELPHGTFQRTVTLPVEIDAGQADATFEHGILRLSLPKAEQARPKQIRVRSVEPEQVTSGETKEG
jgi:HSP20 family protein